MVNEHAETFAAGGSILPCRFVKPDTSQDQAVVVAGTNEDAHALFGDAECVFDGTYAAIAGDPLKVFIPPAECLLELGGTITAGDDIKSDSVGRGVVAAVTGTARQLIRAKALKSGLVGEKIPVIVEKREIYPVNAS